MRRWRRNTQSKNKYSVKENSGKHYKEEKSNGIEEAQQVVL